MLNLNSYQISNPQQYSCCQLLIYWRFDAFCKFISLVYNNLQEMKKGGRAGPGAKRGYGRFNQANTKPILIGVPDSTASPQIEKISEMDLIRHVQKLQTGRIDDDASHEQGNTILDKTNPNFPLTQMTIPVPQISKSSKQRKSLKALRDFEDELQNRLQKRCTAYLLFDKEADEQENAEMKLRHEDQPNLAQGHSSGVEPPESKQAQKARERNKYIQILHATNANIFPEDLILQFELANLQQQQFKKSSTSTETLGKISQIKQRQRALQDQRNEKRRANLLSSLEQTKKSNKPMAYNVEIRDAPEAIEETESQRNARLLHKFQMRQEQERELLRDDDIESEDEYGLDKEREQSE